MNQIETPQPTSDERVMAALAHFFGLFAALIIWVTQKDKSRFVRFQSLQAMAFDAALLVFSLLLTTCMLGVMFLGVLGMIAAAAQSSSWPENLVALGVGSMLFPFAILICILPVSLAALLVRTAAAVSVATGRNFKYPLIAGRVEAFLASPGISGQQSTSQQIG